MPSAVPQPVAAKLTRAAIFLAVTIKPDPEYDAVVRSLCADVAALVRAVGFRDLEGRLSCVMGIGSDAWDRLFGAPKPITERQATSEGRGSRRAASIAAAISAGSWSQAQISQ